MFDDFRARYAAEKKAAEMLQFDIPYSLLRVIRNSNTECMSAGPTEDTLTVDGPHGEYLLVGKPDSDYTTEVTKKVKIYAKKT